VMFGQEATFSCMSRHENEIVKNIPIYT